jgi:hypothetical protein
MDILILVRNNRVQRINNVFHIKKKWRNINFKFFNVSYQIVRLFRLNDSNILDHFMKKGFYFNLHNFFLWNLFTIIKKNWKRCLCLFFHSKKHINTTHKQRIPQIQRINNVYKQRRVTENLISSPLSKSLKIWVYRYDDLSSSYL